MSKNGEFLTKVQLGKISPVSVGKISLGKMEVGDISHVTGYALKASDLVQTVRFRDQRIVTMIRSFESV